MFLQWVIDGVAAGVRVSFAVLTVAGVAAAILALVGLLSYAVGGKDEKASRRY